MMHVPQKVLLLCSFVLVREETFLKRLCQLLKETLSEKRPTPTVESTLHTSPTSPTIEPPLLGTAWLAESLGTRY